MSRAPPSRASRQTFEFCEGGILPSPTVSGVPEPWIFVLRRHFYISGACRNETFFGGGNLRIEGSRSSFSVLRTMRRLSRGEDICVLGEEELSIGAEGSAPPVRCHVNLGNASCVK